MNILADASIPGLDKAFPKPFKLSCYYSPDEITNLLNGQDILLCRSTLKVNNALLNNNNLKFVATASSGTDHLDRDYLQSQNISIIDAKGSNADSVTDYVLSCLAFLKKKHQLNVKKAGIIGVGKVGTKVLSQLKALDFELSAYDPLKAEQDNLFKSCTLNSILDSDLICIHAELHNNPPYPSFNLIDDNFLTQLKPGCIIINAARGGIVNEKALLNNPQPLIYCTDVYLNEPDVNKGIIDKATLCTPHIAGHSLEAKYAAVALVSEKLHRILGLPIPEFAVPVTTHPLSLNKEKSWEDLILSIYNPADETKQLKQAVDKNLYSRTTKKT